MLDLRSSIFSRILQVMELSSVSGPEHLSMAILGHSANTVAANYGSGYAIDVMREALVKVWGE